MIRAGNTILFQGDSITDTQRDREITQANYSHALGVGYCNHRRQLPNVQLILCEPFTLRCGVVKKRWIEDIVKQLAEEFETCFMPFQAALNSVLKYARAEYWLADGVHPTIAGHRVLAECWYETVIGERMDAWPGSITSS